MPQGTKSKTRKLANAVAELNSKDIEVTLERAMSLTGKTERQMVDVDELEKLVNEASALTDPLTEAVGPENSSIGEPEGELPGDGEKLSDDLLERLQMLQDLADSLQAQVIQQDWRPDDVRMDESGKYYLFSDPWGNPRQFAVATYLKCVSGQDTFAFLKKGAKTQRRQLTPEEFRSFVEWIQSVIDELQGDCKVCGQPITDEVPAESIASQVTNGRRVLPHTKQAKALSKRDSSRLVTPARSHHICRFIEPVIGRVALEANFELEKVDVDGLVSHVEEVTNQVNASIDEKNEKMGPAKADRHLPHVAPLVVLEYFKNAWTFLTSSKQKEA